MSAGRVLVVCTGNVCRSPFVERVLAAHLPDVEVSSAGTAALVGHPMDERAEERLVARGYSAGDFRARQVSAGLVEQADLVLVLTRAHRSEVLGLAPRALKRVHVLGDLAELAVALPSSVSTSAAQRRVADTVERLTAHRGGATPLSAQQVDVVDPYRRRSAVYDEMARQLDILLPPVINVLRSQS